MTEGPFRLVIAGHDGSSGGRDALSLGALLAQPAGRVLAAAVFRNRHAADGALIEGVAADAAAVGGDAEHPVARSAAAGLHDLAEELGADLLVLGSSRQAADGRLLAGREAERLLHGAPCAVAVAPCGCRAREQRLRVVGLGYDGSPEADVALAGAISVALAHEATMRIFTAVAPSPPAIQEELRRATRDRLEQASRDAWERAPDSLRAAANVELGEPTAVLRDEAEKGVDLLAVGSRGFGPLQRVLSGSVATSLMRDLACPLLVFPRGVQRPGRLERVGMP